MGVYFFSLHEWVMLAMLLLVSAACLTLPRNILSKEEVIEDVLRTHEVAVEARMATDTTPCS